MSVSRLKYIWDGQAHKYNVLCLASHKMKNRPSISIPRSKKRHFYRLSLGIGDFYTQFYIWNKNCKILLENGRAKAYISGHAMCVMYTREWAGALQRYIAGLGLPMQQPWLHARHFASFENIKKWKSRNLVPVSDHENVFLVQYARLYFRQNILWLYFICISSMDP